MKIEINRIGKLACAGVCALAIAGLAGASPAQAQGKMKRQKSDPSTSGSSTMNKSMSSDPDYYTYRDPAPLNYPMAAPGSLEMFHYDSYHGNNIMQGSVTDARMDRQREMDRRTMKGMTIKDDEMMADPAPVSYPMAAPGSLSMFYFDTYRGNTIKQGSITDTRMDKEMMRDKTRFGDPMHFDRQMLANPFPVNYPFAAPGTLDMYSFKDYSANELQQGSASDKTMDVEKKRDRMQRTAPKTTK